jgi:hypothetical protein
LIPDFISLLQPPFWNEGTGLDPSKHALELLTYRPGHSHRRQVPR